MLPRERLVVVISTSIDRDSEGMTLQATSKIPQESDCSISVLQDTSDVSVSGVGLSDLHHR